MAPAAVIECVCELPRRSWAAKTKSVLQLLDEVSAFQHLQDVTPEEIADYLQARPFLIEDWLNHSANNRSSPAPYFLRTGKGYEVGVSPAGVPAKHDDAVEACTDFIVRYLSGLKSNRRL